MIPHWARLTPFVGRLSLRYRFRETGASKVGFQQDWLSQKQERICRGTEGSNPFPSSGESANHRSLSGGAEPRVRIPSPPAANPVRTSMSTTIRLVIIREPKLVCPPDREAQGRRRSSKGHASARVYR